MSLDVLERGFVEQIIDQKIAQIPWMLKFVRTTEYKKLFQINNEEDYIYGMIHGQILEKYLTYHSMMYPKITAENIEKLQEVSKIIGNRSKEIKETIFKTG